MLFVKQSSSFAKLNEYTIITASAKEKRPRNIHLLVQVWNINNATSIKLIHAITERDDCNPNNSIKIRNENAETELQREPLVVGRLRLSSEFELSSNPIALFVEVWVAESQRRPFVEVVIGNGPCNRDQYECAELKRNLRERSVPDKLQ